MAKEDEVKKLQMTIVELQNQLKELRAARKPVDISADEIKAYMKVKDVLQVDYGEFCGINECRQCISICRVCTICRICAICRVCRVCDVECACGPCASFGSYYGSGMNRFSELGE